MCGTFLILRNLFLLTLFTLLTQSAEATTYCVSGDPAADNSNACTSTIGDCSEVLDADACETPYIVETKSGSITAGDSILLKRGVTFACSGSSISAGSDGTVGSLQTLSGFQTAGNWNNEGNNVWSMSLSTFPRELHLDSVEYARARRVDLIDSTNRWAWKPIGYRNGYKLFVYSLGNPSTFYSTMQYRDESGYITLGAYGSGADPKISSKATITGWDTEGNWTDNGGSIANSWYITLATNPGRVFLSGVEYAKAEALDTDPTGLNSTYRWIWVDASDRLYIYATSNPALAYSNVEGIGNCSTLFDIQGGDDYWKVDNITFEGGSSTTLLVRGSQATIIQNSTFQYYVNAFLANCGSDLSSNDNGIFRNNLIDGKLEFTHNYDDFGVNDGVTFRDANQYWMVYENDIPDAGHSPLVAESSDPTPGCGGNRYIEFFNNKTYSEDADNGAHGISFSGGEGETEFNEMYLNWMDDYQQSGVSVNGNNNHIHDNLLTNGFRAAYFTTAGSSINPALKATCIDPYVCHDNLVENNVVYNNDDLCIHIDHQSSGGTPGETKHDNIFRNNSCLDTGNSPLTSLYQDICINVDLGSTVGANTFQNNHCYNSNGQTDFIRYQSANYTASGFNALNGSTNPADVISSNIGGDPLFTDAENNDFRISSSSPLKNAGTTGTPGTYDWYGNKRPIGNYDIGLNENEGVPAYTGVTIRGARR